MRGIRAAFDPTFSWYDLACIVVVGDAAAKNAWWFLALIPLWFVGLIIHAAVKGENQ